jgi:preprotein translocase subunit SecG
MMSVVITIVTSVYVLTCVVLILVVLLQAGRGGGMGSLGGGGSQAVFGGSGGADFLARLTQGLAAAFMCGAVFLAYASSHTGSSRLQDESAKLEAVPEAEPGEIDWERVGPNPLPLPTSEEGQAARALPPPEGPPKGEPTPPSDASPVADAPAEVPAEVPASAAAAEPTDERAPTTPPRPTGDPLPPVP